MKLPLRVRRCYRTTIKAASPDPAEVRLACVGPGASVDSFPASETQP
jgi:hypothetical protein